MDKTWNVYPRPQLVREDWMSLNGEWRFNDTERISVPFCPESKLSGIERRIQPGEKMVYERAFVMPDSWADKRKILHFGAVDQEAMVYVNGTAVSAANTEFLRIMKKDGEAVSGDEKPSEVADVHEGGYLPFSFDVTDYLKSGINTVKVEAVDKLDHKYPWGKQKADNGGMWYTPVSGIWQSVWMEAVPEEHVTSLKIDAGLDWVEIRAYGIEAGTIELLGEKHNLIKEEGIKCASIHIDIHRPHLWTPEDPYLYDFTITAGADTVRSYFALRTIGIKEVDGYKRLCLNGEPYFFNGLLDQGYWQEGIYTPPEPECFERDILAMKSLGFNTLRKHIKVEPEQFYYDCDRLGMVVFQDMVNNGNYTFFHDTALPTVGMKRLSDRNRNTNKQHRETFLKMMDETVMHLYNHPCICYWTIFNEGWGQFYADDAYDRLKELDPSRIVDSTSGWFWQSKSDVDSHHVYFKALSLEAGERPLVLSEFGGYACKLSDHCWNKDKTYGYKTCRDEADLLAEMAKLYDQQVLPLVKKGLCAAIYTQVSDVEDETNGLLTYDREVQKFEAHVGTGRIEIIGNHTDHQGGRILVAPTPQKIRAYVADNHRDVIKIASEGFKPFEVSLKDRSKFEKGTTQALVTGILAAFAELFGEPEAAGRGFDCRIKSEVGVGSGLSSSAAFEILLARIINERFYGGEADAVQIAKIGQFAEREYYGKQCGMMDQLAISLGQMAMLDFGGREPEYELVDFDFAAAGYEIKIVPTESDHTALDSEYDAIPADMFKVAEVMGVSRLGDLNIEQFKRNIPMLEEKVAAGDLTEFQVNRARHFYEENERVLAGAIALQTGNVQKFLNCVNESGLSSENLLKNVVPSGAEENDLSRKLAELHKDPEVLACKLEGGGFGGSILAFTRK